MLAGLVGPARSLRRAKPSHMILLGEQFTRHAVALESLKVPRLSTHDALSLPSFSAPDDFRSRGRGNFIPPISGYANVLLYDKPHRGL